MKIYEYVMKGRITSLMPFILVILCCFIRLNAPTEGTDSIINYLDLFVYVLFPIPIWFYVQRIHRYYSSGFVQIREENKVSIFLKQTIVDSIAVILFCLYITLIHILIMMNTEISLLEYPLLFLRLSALYLSFISLFHVIFLIKKDTRIAFVLSYCFLLFINFSNTIFYFSMKVSSEAFHVYYILTFLLIFVVAEVGIYVFSKRKRDIYEIYL